MKKAKMRGVTSFGMLSSASELGLAEKAEGIIELPEDAQIGQDLRDYFDLDDSIIEVDLTPNRGDCFSIRGIARDVGVLSNSDVLSNDVNAVNATSDQTFSIDIQSPGGCPNYVGRVITDINTNAATPLWMQERLRRSSLRSIHPVVDITNYVMLELGQPMHAFDLAKLEDRIIVRKALQGEKLTLLDEQEVELDKDTLVIADQKNALALAGIMGGLDSSVTESTTDLFLESAFFTPAEMAGKARMYKVQTDSSHRFERGVDFRLQAIAIERATQLILDVCGGNVGPVLQQSSEENLPERSAIELRKARITRVLGVEFDNDYIETSLTRLGIAIEKTKDGWAVTSPSHRFDIAIEADLIEEIARVKGYNNLTVNNPAVSMVINPRTEAQLDINSLRNILVAKGYQEAITYSFVEPAMQNSLTQESFTEQEQAAIDLMNPISKDMSVMRRSLLTGLSQALIYNLNRQNDRIRLFETGMVFVKENDQIVQKNVLAGITSGDTFPEQWGSSPKTLDFYDLKNDVEALLSRAGNLSNYEFKKANHFALHPGQSADIYKNGQKIGYMGMLSPVVTPALGLEIETGFFQLDLTTVLDGTLPSFSALSKYPFVRRDISLLVDKDVEASKISSCIKGNKSQILKNVQLFDIYHGEGIDSMKKSVALGLIFQGTSSTLVDQEIDEILEKILSKLKSDIGATPRI
ncbi:MAG: phenylalanine--tRNA ligase subunit beta [Gammaproteobacteria bacterium]